MQISLEEVQQVARDCCAQQAGAVSQEPVPAPFVACEETDRRLAYELARSLAEMPDAREERIAEVVGKLKQTVEPVPASVIAVSIMRRLIADNLSK